MPVVGAAGNTTTTTTTSKHRNFHGSGKISLIPPKVKSLKIASCIVAANYEQQRKLVSNMLRRQRPKHRLLHSSTTLTSPEAQLAAVGNPQVGSSPMHRRRQLSLSLFFLLGHLSSAIGQLEQRETINRLEVPAAMLKPFVQGPGVDLVGLNRRRFELQHRHLSHSSEQDLKLGELIESKLSSIPERFLSQLPEDLSQRVLESLATEPALIGIPGVGGGVSQPFDHILQDPEEASIERLSKSCLTVHASSASPDQLNVTFHLYTRLNPYLPFIMKPHVTRFELLKASPFQVNKPIKWITHGFHTNVDKSEWMLNAKDKILLHEDANVFLTDWRRGASPALAFYPKAAANAHVVAKMIVKILRRLQPEVQLSQVHLIGHSLGAHIMGFVGSAFTEDYLQQQQQSLMLRRPDEAFWRDLSSTRPEILPLIGRITACDPALPCFGPSSSAPNSLAARPNRGQPVSPQVATSTTDNSTSLDLADWTPSMWTHLRPDSAVLVEVIHSNPGVMGYTDPLGDYDFYPNGFDKQPGCGNDPSSKQKGELEQTTTQRRVRRQIMGMLSSLWGSRKPAQVPESGGSASGGSLEAVLKPIRDFFLGYTCSHHRSVDYMVESMYYERIPAQRKLDPEFVCQMVGYRCRDYQAFKRGHCFRCDDNQFDCRAFSMSSHSVPAREVGQPNSPSSSFWLKLHPPEAFNKTSRHRRVLPNFNYRMQHYSSQQKNQYYFDTRSASRFCLHHYHILIVYRHLRIRDSIQVDGLKLLGRGGQLFQNSPATFHKYTHQSFTMLLTEQSFLGQLEALVIYGDKIQAAQVEFVEVTYMSNLDPKVRASSSARLCRSQRPVVGGLVSGSNPPRLSSASLFVSCTASLV